MRDLLCLGDERDCWKVNNKYRLFLVKRINKITFLYLLETEFSMLLFWIRSKI